MSNIRDIFSASRARRPPVHLTYAPRHPESGEEVELPFVIGVLADLFGNSDTQRVPVSDRKWIEIDSDDFDVCLKSVQPGVRFTVENMLDGGGDIQVELDFNSMDDFLPGAIATSVPELCEWAGQQANSRSAVDSTAASRQLSLILHHPELMKLEGAWRGLHYLAQHTQTSELLRIRVFLITKKEFWKIARSFRGDKFERSNLFKLICENPMGRREEDFFGCLIGDFEFGHSDEDIQILEFMMKIAADAHAPFLAAASPGLLHFDYWHEIGNPHDVNTRSPEYAGWWALRDEPDARYIGLALPRFLARSPFGQGEHKLACPEIEFEEDLTAGEAAELVWANPAYLCGVIAARAFDRYRWFAHTIGIESGGEIEGLPGYPGVNVYGDYDPRSSVEVAIDERREAELSKFGLMPFLAKKNSNMIALFSFQSIQRPAEYEDHRATAMAHLAARYRYHLNICRLILYLKAITRDHYGLFRSPAELEHFLNDWLQRYVDPHPKDSNEYEMAQRPLAAARVEFSKPNDYGWIEVKFVCQPNYQLEGLTCPLLERFWLSTGTFRNPVIPD
jgi:type VI secretion system protein ImpC